VLAFERQTLDQTLARMESFAAEVMPAQGG